MFQLLLLLLLLRHSTAAGACATDEDCALLGTCTAAGACACHAGWAGPACGQLRLLPAPVSGGYSAPNTSSWGGAPVLDSATGRYHLYVAEFVGRCGLLSWHNNSRVVRATAAAATGPYTFAEEVVPFYSHNPVVALAANGSGLILMHIGGGAWNGDVLQCVNGSSQTNYSALPRPPQPPPPAQGTLCAGGFAGPWRACNWTGAASPGSFTNPALWVQRNGSMAVGGNSNYSLALAFGARCSAFACQEWSPALPRTPPRTGEDPWIWQDARDHWHALFHDMAPDLPAGRHAFSADGLAWTLTAELAYTGAVEFEDGSSVAFTKRERPHLLLDPASRAPLALFTGVMQHPEHVDDHTFTLAQAVAWD